MECKQEKDVSCDDDVILLNCDEMPRPMNISSSRLKKRQERREVSIKKGCQYKNKETLVITQKVELKKQRSRCVININTKYVSKMGSKYGKVHSSAIKKEVCEERETPHCLRPNCWPHRSRVGCQRIKHRNQCNLSKGKYHENSRHNLSKNLRQLCSPILSSPWESDLTYEDVSLGSFQDNEESKIDTLIKRTRDRDRKQQACKSETIQPLWTSTPKYEDITDDKDFNENDKSKLQENGVLTTDVVCETLLMEFSPIKHESIYNPQYEKFINI